MAKTKNTKRSRKSPTPQDTPPGSPPIDDVVVDAVDPDNVVDPDNIEEPANGGDAAVNGGDVVNGGDAVNNDDEVNGGDAVNSDDEVNGGDAVNGDEDAVVVQAAPTVHVRSTPRKQGQPTKRIIRVGSHPSKKLGQAKQPASKFLNNI
jgi:hypothetical protein